jgi:hypothetical protein
MGSATSPSAEDMAQLAAWAHGPGPALARFGRAALKLAGADPDSVAPPVDTPARAPSPVAEAPPPAPAPTVEVIAPSPSAQAIPGRPTKAAKPSVSHGWTQGLPRPKGMSAPPRPPLPAPPRRRDRGPWQGLEQFVRAAAVVLPVRVIRASP